MAVGNLLMPYGPVMPASPWRTAALSAPAWWASVLPWWASASSAPPCVGVSSALVGCGFLCSALVCFCFICSALAGFLICLPVLDLSGLDLVLSSPGSAYALPLFWTVLLLEHLEATPSRGCGEVGYCHSHQFSRLCTTFPSIPLVTHLHSLVNHSHLESISGSSSPVAANQAPP